MSEPKMKYFNFDIVRCVRDYPDNYNKVIMSEKIVKNIKRRLTAMAQDDPDRDNWELLMTQYISKLEEYQFYCTLVKDGLRAISEVERKCLEWWLWDRLPNDKLKAKLNCASYADLKAIKTVALKHIAEVAAPHGDDFLPVAEIK